MDTLTTPDEDEALRILKFLAPDSDPYYVIVAEGEPVPKSRPRFTKQGHAFSDPKQVKAENALGVHLKNVVPEPLSGNVAIGCIFYRSTRRNIDMDNLVKLVLDAANGILWRDDVQVTASVSLLELDRERPRTVIAVANHTSTMIRT